MFSLSEKRKERIAAEKTIDIAEAIIYRISTLLSLSSEQKPLLEKITYEFAKNVYATQSLTIKDIDAYIDILYLSRYILPSFDHFRKYGLSTILTQRIFVPIDVMAQFDDWEGFRQSALYHGLMLTSDATAPSVADWNKELSLFMHPLFNSSNPAPSKDILERIVQLAVDARCDAANLPEYIASFADYDFERETQYLSKLDTRIQDLIFIYVRQQGIIPEVPPTDLYGMFKRMKGHIRRWDVVCRQRIQILIEEELEFQKQHFNNMLKNNI